MILRYFRLPSRFAAYRIAQEAISNAIKHGGAQHVTVCMIRDDNGLTIRIDDDGLGFGSDVNPTGVGLVSIRERATELAAVADMNIRLTEARGLKPGFRSRLSKVYGEAQSGWRPNWLRRHHRFQDKSAVRR